jgi:hypothetical protein
VKPRVSESGRREKKKKEKTFGESEKRFVSVGVEKEHLVRRYPGNARSSF